MASECADARRVSIGSATVFALAASYLVIAAAPGLLWHDTGEFGAVGWRLSLSHPPGHPTHAMTTHMGLRLIPAGSLGFRSNLVSVLCVAMALAGLYAMMRRWIPSIRGGIAWALAVLPLGVPAVVEQATRSEVYGLQLLFSVGLAHLCFAVAEGKDQRNVIYLSALFGLAGANHSYLGLFWIPFALAAIIIGRIGWRALVGAAVAGAFTLSTYSYLYFRATKGGETGWGEPTTAAELWTIISGKEWVKSLPPGEEYPPLTENVSALLGYVVDHLSPVMTAILVIIIILAVPRWVERRHWTILGVAFAILIPFASRAPYGVDLHNPDLGGYVASSFLAMVFLTGSATTVVPRAVHRWTAAIVVIASLGLVGYRSPVEAATDRSALQYVREVLREVPIDGTVVVSDYSTQFGLWWLRALEGARPDVAIVFRGQIDVDWYARRLVRSHPRAADRLSGFPTSFDHPDTRWEPGVRFEQLGRVALRLRPVGLTLAQGDIWPSIEHQKTKFAAFDGAGFSGRRFEALQHTFMVEHIIGLQGPSTLARWHVEQLKRLAPDDPWTIALDKRLIRLEKTDDPSTP